MELMVVIVLGAIACFAIRAMINAGGSTKSNSGESSGDVYGSNDTSGRNASSDSSDGFDWHSVDDPSTY